MVGVAAVMVMVAVGRGAEARVLERIQALGPDLLIVSAAPAPRIAGRPRDSDTVTLLRSEDAQRLVQETTHARSAAASVTRPVRARWSDRSVPTTLNGITPEGLRLRNVSVRSGRLFDEDDERERRRVVLLGPTTARSLFGAVNPIGLEIRIGHSIFEVIGVTQPRGADLAGADQDDVILIPLETALRRVLNVAYVNTILVQARSTSDLSRLEADVKNILAALYAPRTGAPEPFRIQNQTLLLQMERGAARSLTKLVVGVAAISFVVGGVGILSVGLMSVRERMREVGLRRAMGARKRDVQLQFLVEAGIIALVGGALGVLLGALAATLAALFGPWDLLISWGVALAALASSAAVGIIAGVIPAWKASRLEPIDALRSTGRR
jgi:putative ABC transport system permease protein